MKPITIGAFLAVALGMARLIAQPVPPSTDMPVFRITATARSIQAINYNHRQGATNVALTGTSLMPKASGDARVESRAGATKIDIHFSKLDPAQTHGDSFLTYVVWAITPEGRSENLGEVSLSGSDARLQAATELQTFGLIVTAEPYFAVTQPSDTVVMEGVAKSGSDGTTGTIGPVEAKYELIEHGAYDAVLPPAERALMKQKGDAPLDLKQARHAMAVARSIGANTYAAETMRKARIDLENAEGFWASRKDTKRVQTLARNVTQLAEDARLITVRRLQEDRLAAERQAAEASVAAAKSEAERETAKRELAESERRQALLGEEEARNTAAREAQMRTWAETQKRELAAARADAERMLAETKSKLELTQGEVTQAKADADTARLQAAAGREALARSVAESDQAKRELEAARSAQTETERQLAAAEEARKTAENDRVRLRVEIREQLNRVLETKESARGLIVNMSDVLFDTAQFTLRPGAREKLAKVAGILLSHPDLHIEIEGHTDSVGGDEYNQKLSEQRAGAVKEYLIAQGVASSVVTSRGFGKERPVASNDTAAGRQRNRRVEMVVAGESIRTSSR